MSTEQKPPPPLPRRTYVVVTDIDIPFKSMVLLWMKTITALIPALIMLLIFLGLIAWIAGILFGLHL